MIMDDFFEEDDSAPVDEGLTPFEAVCPHCSATFVLDEEVISLGFDSDRAEQYLKIQCPTCGGIRLVDVEEE